MLSKKQVFKILSQIAILNKCNSVNQIKLIYRLHGEKINMQAHTTSVP